MNRHQQKKYAAQDAGRRRTPAEPQVVYVDTPPATPAPGGMTPEAIEQLKELAQLKDQGILTDEEFAAQKAKILGS